LSIKENIAAQLAVIHTRFLVGGALVFASYIKIKGLRFTSASGELEPIHSAWHFFETLYQSGFYWKFIGLSQLIAGALLMTQRYARLGALVTLPMMLNIFVITVSYDFTGTPLITGMMLLTNLALIFWDIDMVKSLLNQPISELRRGSVEANSIWEKIGLALFLFTSIYRILNDRYDIFFWFGGCAVITIVGFILWYVLDKRHRLAKINP
jgi:hypothetical protein